MISTGGVYPREKTLNSLLNCFKAKKTKMKKIKYNNSYFSNINNPYLIAY